MPKINLQNTTKTQRYLECFEARPGNKIVAMDFASLEPKVLAYFSRDKNLMSLYGPSNTTCYSVDRVIKKLEEAGIKYELKNEELIIYD